MTPHDRWAEEGDEERTLVDREVYFDLDAYEYHMETRDTVPAPPPWGIYAD